MTVEQLMGNRGELPTTMGIEYVELGAERVVATMPVEGNRQPFGLLHGGASGVLIETAGSIAATMHAYPMGKIAVGIELSVSHHRGVREGLITCTVTALSLGRSLASYQAEIVDAEGKRIATGRLTCMLREGSVAG